MKRKKITYRSTMSTEITEGESIEKKIDRMVETNEPIGETLFGYYWYQNCEININKRHE